MTLTNRIKTDKKLKRLKTIEKKKKIKISKWIDPNRKVWVYLQNRFSEFFVNVCDQYVIGVFGFLTGFFYQEKQCGFLVLLTHSPHRTELEQLQNFWILFNACFVFWLVWNDHWTVGRHILGEINVASVGFPVHNQVAVAAVSGNVNHVLLLVKVFEF